MTGLTLNATAVNDATSAENRRARGLQAYVSGDLAGAHAHLLAAIRLDPLHADAICDLAAAELERGDGSQALHWARRALVLEPEHDAGRFTAAIATHACGDVHGATLQLEALARDPAFAGRNPELLGAARQRLLEWRGVDRGDAGGLLILDPTQASFRHRFDILAKYLYAQSRLGMLPPWCNVDVHALYRRHIHLRTGGVEPGSEREKCSLEHYERDFDALIASVAHSGFDPNHPVPISDVDGLPRNGAHRIAAALAARCHIAAIAEPGPGGRWDDEWFRVHGFGREERNALLRAWASIKQRDAFVVLLWSPVHAAWPQIEARIDAVMPVVSRRTIELPARAFSEFVHDVYAFDWGPGTGENIERKVALLGRDQPRVRVLFVERPADADAELARQTKQSIREHFAKLSPVEDFTTLHISETPEETAHLLAIVASENNLRWLAHRAPARAELVDRLGEMHAAMITRGIAPSQCCVVGGSVLDALGLREAHDLDFTLRGEPRAAHFDPGVTRVSEHLDVVTQNYPRAFGDEPAIGDDRMIENPSHHFMVRGVRFADPRIVLTRKQHQRRDKDLRDVELLADLFERIAHP